MKWDARGLAAAIVSDVDTGMVLMLGWMNAESLERTRSTGKVWFWSRSREKLWMKGETSGNTLEVIDIRQDCDRDALLVRARPNGPTCHNGTQSCFADESGEPVAHPIDILAATLETRVSERADKSYTAKLLAAGPEKISAKIREEGGELADAITSESNERVASEAADVIYHLLVGLLARGVEPRDVWAELRRRSGTSGLVEKARREAPK